MILLTSMAKGVTKAHTNFRVCQLPASQSILNQSLTAADTCFHPSHATQFPNANRRVHPIHVHTTPLWRSRTVRRLGARLRRLTQLSFLELPRRRRPAEHRLNSGLCKFFRHSAMDAGADSMLVSRIMVASSTLEIERSAETCAVGYGDLRPLARDGVWQ